MHQVVVYLALVLVHQIKIIILDLLSILPLHHRTNFFLHQITIPIPQTLISDTSSKAEETKETLDWIETELDRIKRNIDLVDKTASSTYKNWSKRNEALASELSQVSNELNVQQQAYDRYIQQANSVGLSEDWASKVRDGRIDIETITDSDLKDKISDYKTW